MSTYTQILYQIVFTTKNRRHTLKKNNREKLYKYIRGLLSNKKCVMYIANGNDDHIHILTNIHPSVSLSALVKDIKLSTSAWIKTNQIYKDFDGWQQGYGAFTYSIKEKDAIFNYIQNQEANHKKVNPKEEYLNLLIKNGVDFNEKYLL